MTPQFEENYHELVAISWIIRIKLSKHDSFVQRWTPLCNFYVTVIKKISIQGNLCMHYMYTLPCMLGEKKVSQLHLSSKI